MRVMICEDDPILALDLEVTVTAAGGRPCGQARTYDEAVDLAEAARPAVALIDLHLGDGRTGPQVAQEMVQRGIRVLVISGDTSVDPQLAAIDHVFIPKPVKPAVLQQILGMALSAAKAERESLRRPNNALPQMVAVAEAGTIPSGGR
jgi:DNA-binding NtrC family response regulator